MPKKLITMALTLSLMLSTTGVYPYGETFTLLTKKQKNGTTHCIWLIHDRHEPYRNLSKKTTKYIIKNGRNDIRKIALKLGKNTRVYVEDSNHYPSMPDFNPYDIRHFCKDDKNPMLLGGLYKFLKKNNIKVTNIETRPFLFIHYKDRKACNQLKLYTCFTLLFLAIFSYMILAYFDRTILSKVVPILFVAPIGISYGVNKLRNKTKLALYRKIDKISNKKRKNKILKTVKKWKKEDLQEFKKWKKEKLKAWKEKKYNKSFSGFSYKQKLNATEINIKYCYYLESYTITKILNNLHKTKLHKKYMHKFTYKPNCKHDYKHDIVAAGSFHCNRIKQAFIKEFGYKKRYSISIPEPENKPPDVILKIEKCFEKGLKILSQNKE
ncbi:hypothetical protein ACFLYU_05225 [Candidatus Dependentiae bacterium]